MELDRIRSFALRTDLALERQVGEVVLSEDGVLVSRMPHNPLGYVGNCLSFPGPPGPGDFGSWMERFAVELDPEGTRHRYFRWDGRDGAAGLAEPFVEAGFELGVYDVLTATGVVDSARPPGVAVELRPAYTDRDWQAIGEHWITCNRHDGGELDGETYHTYVALKLAEHRRRVESGFGHWWAAWRDGDVLADLGLFFDRFEDGALGRFQSVQTHPEHRRRGLCRALVCHAARAGIEANPGARLVIVATAEGAAGRVYRSAGFEATERCADLLRKRPAPADQ